MTTSSTKTPAKGRQFIEPCVYTVPWKNKFLSDAIRLPLFHNEKVMPFHRSTHTHTFINMHMGEKTGFIPRFWIQKQNFFFFSQTFVTLRVRKQPPLNEPLSFSFFFFWVAPPKSKDHVNSFPSEAQKQVNIIVSLSTCTINKYMGKISFDCIEAKAFRLAKRHFLI